MTVHALPADTLAARQQRTRLGRLKMLLVLAVCAAPVVASYLLFYVVQPRSGGAAYAQLVDPPRALPAELATLKGQWLLVVAAPSACDAACEQQLYAQRQLREMLGRERDRLDKVWLVPDSGALRPALAQALAADPAVQVRRVPPATLQAWLAPAPGRSLQDHLYLVDPMGRWMMRTPVPLDPAKFKRDLDRLLRASASWDRPGRHTP
jgi:hypothetical protein